MVLRLLLTILIVICSHFLYSEDNVLFSPKNVFEELVLGNKRFAEAKAFCIDDLQESRSRLLTKQRPIAIVVGCSDSRVPPELIFNQSLGDLFIVRVSGNVIGPLELDSIEFAAKHLNVPLIVILGHESCGTVRAALNGEDVADNLENIAPLIRKASSYTGEFSGDPLERLAKANVLFGVEKLKSYPPFQKLIEQNSLRIVGGYYRLHSGIVEFFPPDL